MCWQAGIIDCTSSMSNSLQATHHFTFPCCPRLLHDVQWLEFCWSVQIMQNTLSIPCAAGVLHLPLHLRPCVCARRCSGRCIHELSQGISAECSPGAAFAPSLAFLCQFAVGVSATCPTAALRVISSCAHQPGMLYSDAARGVQKAALTQPCSHELCYTYTMNIASTLSGAPVRYAQICLGLLGGGRTFITPVQR